MSLFNFIKAPSKKQFLKTWQHNHEAQLRYLSHSAQLEEAGNPRFVRLIVITVSCFVLLFVFWASIAQINEVTRASGEIVPDGFQQSIQHLEGGIVAEILVGEGSVVEAEQPLVRLSSEGLQEDMARLQHKLNLLNLQEERLTAFIESRAINLNEFHDISIKDVEKQKEIFKSMKDLSLTEEEVIRRQITQKEQDLLITNTKLKTVKSRLKVLEELYQKRESLYMEGFFPQVKLMAMEDEIVVLKGEKEQLQQLQKQAQAAYLEFSDKLRSLTASQRDKGLQQIEQVQAEIKQTSEMLEKINARIHRLVIRAPEKGIIKGLNVGTIGGVIQPGQVMMEIVPLDHNITAEIRILPSDIGNLFVGETVKVKVSAYDFSRYGSITGKLSSLSATTFAGEDGARYYKGRVKLNQNYVGDVVGRNPVLLGMTVMADIVTGQRSVLSYLFKPIQSSLETAFQEK